MKRNVIFICHMYLNLMYATIMAVALPWQLNISHNGHALASFHLPLPSYYLSIVGKFTDSPCKPGLHYRAPEIAPLKEQFMKGIYCACLGPELE